MSQYSHNARLCPAFCSRPTSDSQGGRVSGRTCVATALLCLLLGRQWQRHSNGTGIWALLNPPPPPQAQLRAPRSAFHSLAASSSRPRPSPLPFEHPAIRPTRQLCYAQSDESELCIYDGPVCYDGAELFVVVDDGQRRGPAAYSYDVSDKAPPAAAATSAAGGAGLAAQQQAQAAALAAGAAERSQMTSGYDVSGRREGPCMDWRLCETKEHCSYAAPPLRNCPPAAARCSVYGGADTAAGFADGPAGKLYASACAEATLTTPVSGRAWGPDGKAIAINEFPLSRFREALSPEPLPAAGNGLASSSQGGEFAHAFNVRPDDLFRGLWESSGNLHLTPEEARAARGKPRVWPPAEAADAFATASLLLDPSGTRRLSQADHAEPATASLPALTRGFHSSLAQWPTRLLVPSSAPAAPIAESGGANASRGNDGRRLQSPVPMGRSRNPARSWGDLPPPPLGAPGAAPSSARPATAPSGAQWLDGALWVVGMEDSWLLHPWHAASAFMPLFGAKRHNNSIIHVPRGAAGFAPWRQDRESRGGAMASDPRHRELHSARFGREEGEDEGGDDADRLFDGHFLGHFGGRGFGHDGHLAASHGHRVTFGGPGVSLPPMDYVLLTASGSEAVGEWMSGAWPLLAQPHSNLLLRDRLVREMGLKAGTASPHAQGAAASARVGEGSTDGERTGRSWVCAASAVVTGLQPRLFAGTADASAFRLHAWALAGLPVSSNGARTHDHYPPRKIVVVARTDTRRFCPEARLRAIVERTGLPVEWVDDLAFWSWEEQVRLFAGAGVVVAAHGAALANLMFAPAHSAVLELTPHLLNWPLYRRLADASGLFYYRVPAQPRTREELGESLLAHEDFEALCEGEQHVSSLDASSLIACNGRSKNSDVFVDLDLFSTALSQALDDIGCRPRQFSRHQAALLFAAQQLQHAPPAPDLASAPTPKPSVLPAPLAQPSHVPESKAPFPKTNSSSPPKTKAPLGAAAEANAEAPAVVSKVVKAEARAMPRTASGTDFVAPGPEAEEKAATGGRHLATLSAEVEAAQRASAAQRGLHLAAQLGLGDGATIFEDRVWLVQPDGPGARVINVRAQCSEPQGQFRDKSPWD